MKKIFYIWFCMISFISCEDKIQEQSHEVLYYPSKDSFRSDRLSKVNLEDSSEYVDLVRSVNRIYENDSIPYLEFLKENSLIKIIPFRNDYGNFHHRNYINVTKDSAFTFYHKYPLELLGELLKKHYENNGRLPYLSENAEEVIIEIVLNQDANGQDLIHKLKSVITSFDSLNVQ